MTIAAYKSSFNGQTLFTEDIACHSTPAETLLAQYVGQIDGAIISRNALDHCEDPLMILANISSYAATGCYLLLWTDIWHLAGLDEGHHNITRSSEAMTALLKGFGFAVLQPSRSVRGENSGYIEFGAVARKF